MIAATPASSKRVARSSADSSEVSAHPCVATLPSRASRPTATRFGNARAALAEPALDGRHVADAAAELHAQADGLEDAVDRGGVHRLAREGAVEVDHVEMAEAFLLEHVCLRGRVAVEHGGTAHVALLEPHAHTVLEV